jgi:hypothetical protein
MDRHKLWRRVSADYDRLKARAPEGHQPVVEVYLTGRDEPVEVGHVETRRGDDDSWIRLEALNRSAEYVDGSDRPLDPDDRWVHVYEGFIERVEISFRGVGAQPLVFSHTLNEEPDATSD